MRKEDIVRKKDRLGRQYGPYMRVMRMCNKDLAECLPLGASERYDERFLIDKRLLVKQKTTTLVLNAKAYDQLKNTANRHCIDNSRVSTWMKFMQNPTDIVLFRAIGNSRKLIFLTESVQLHYSLGDKLIRINFAKRLE